MVEANGELITKRNQEIIKQQKLRAVTKMKQTVMLKSYQLAEKQKLQEGTC